MFKEWNKEFKTREKYMKNLPFSIYDLANKYLPKDKKAIIIDIGCGNCNFENYLDLWKRYENLMVLDANQYTINELIFSHNNNNHQIKRYIAPNTLPFKNESVDYIYCSHLIEHLNFKELYKLFIEINRVLKFKGIIIINTPLLWIHFYNTFSHIKPYPLSIFKQYFCGFNLANMFNNPISESYIIKEIVYLYSTFIDIHNRIGSSIKSIDFLIQTFYHIFRSLKIKKYIRNAYTIILEKK